MSPGIICHLPAAVTAITFAATAVLHGGTAAADPSQDQRFFDLLGQKDIPPVDNENSLVTSAKKACSKLDDGMPVGDLVELIRNNGFNENPITRLQPQDRITRTIDLFLNASVEAYCPYNKGKIAGIAAYRIGAPTRRVMLTSFTGTLPAGEIAPTKPLPVPAQPPPQVPQEIQPVPQQPPPPPRHAPPAPRQAPPEEPPPPAEAPQEPPAEAAPPAPAAPGGGGNAPAPGAPGGGAGGGNVPAAPTPDQPAPPGHVRLAP